MNEEVITEKRLAEMLLGTMGFQNFLHELNLEAAHSDLIYAVNRALDTFASEQRWRDALRYHIPSSTDGMLDWRGINKEALCPECFGGSDYE